MGLDKKYRRVKTLNNGPYEITVVIVGDGDNEYKKVRRDVTDFGLVLPASGDKYHIEASKLFLLPRNIFQTLKDRWRKVKHRFIIFFIEGNSKAIGLKGDVKITSSILNIVEKSGALKKALSGMFATAIPSRKILFIGVVAFVIVMVILAGTGQLEPLLQALGVG